LDGICPVLNGFDLLATAPTGSGKTAYLTQLMLMARALAENPSLQLNDRIFIEDPVMLVVSPTKALEVDMVDLDCRTIHVAKEDIGSLRVSFSWNPDTGSTPGQSKDTGRGGSASVQLDIAALPSEHRGRDTVASQEDEELSREVEDDEAAAQEGEDLIDILTIAMDRLGAER
ncbi:hypothetical protein HWV62_45380, partial [Athelia sp. TMB]